MSQINIKIIGLNIKNLREAAGLSQHDFSLIVEISKRTVANIESGSYNYKISVINNILDFFNLDLDVINRQNLDLEIDFRKNLIKHHTIRKSSFLSILEKEPNIIFAIKYHLLKNTFLKEAKEIKEIKKYFENLSWFYKSSSITNSLRRMPEVIDIKKHPTKKNTNVYLKK